LSEQGSANLNHKPAVKQHALIQKRALQHRQALQAQQLSQQKQVETSKQMPKTEAAVKWVVVTKDGKTKLEALPNTTQVDFTTVATHEESVSAPRVFSFLGYKIDVQSKIEVFQQAYIKNYQLGRSHNLMVARFAEFKVAFLGHLLSLLGVSSKDIEKLQKKAIASSVYENKILFAENEYNAELLAIVGGGSSKKMRAQKRAIQEIRKQLVLHAERLGMEDYYNRERVIDIQMEQCRKIYDKFCEEKMNLEYQRAYGAVN
jgi:hypothetical protein